MHRFLSFEIENAEKFPMPQGAIDQLVPFVYILTGRINVLGLI
jgi:hypothetical protein